MGIDRLVTTAADQRTVEFDWGTIVWRDSAELTGTDSLTVGTVTIEPGAHNAEHVHPNCDEALHLCSGELRHSVGDESVELEAGDLVHIPRGEPHQAWNEGDEEAVAVIVYDTGERTVEFVDEDASSE
ncbi:cupin domain-containing protein [Halobacteria archaeon AArc-m2/3/4]|uniref:Cupin domain-containing protein n=1 Tax=Natronoglomus mannanivorans TaxID=2979990 RepID=A0ABT2QKL8_9EURY|nr:cupin domain-containing protein [Halobacteria archaeon AArc-m2/3/4]